VSNFEQPVATKERMFVSIMLRSAAPPSPDTHAAWSKPRNPKRVRVNLGFNLSREAQENEHSQTPVAELEHRREVEKALAEVVDRALADEERLASVILVLHSQGGSLR
jgi:hypothetical protein